MSDIYYMPRTDIEEQPVYYDKLIGVLIRKYPPKHKTAVAVLKEYLKGTPHITEYCNLPYKHIPIDKRDIHINNIELGNFFILPYSKHIYIEVHKIVSYLNLPYTDICCCVFYGDNDIFPLKYSNSFGKYNSSFGTIVINKEDSDVIMEY